MGKQKKTVAAKKFNFADSVNVTVKEVTDTDNKPLFPNFFTPVSVTKATRHKGIVGRVQSELNSMLLDSDADRDVRAELAAARDACERAYRLMAAVK